MSYEIVIFFILLLTGYIFGSYNERKHYRSIIEREKKYQDLFVLNTHKRENDPVFESHLVTGSVVVSVDYFKRITASLVNIFGGNISAYESLLDRGRREAMLRMQEESAKLGAVSIKNIRYETSSISKNARSSMGTIEVLAYGTAMIPANPD
ncbi:MAG: YbjQ family protein [Gammaproteobacteria bacterium]